MKRRAFIAAGLLPALIGMGCFCGAPSAHLRRVTVNTALGRGLPLHLGIEVRNCEGVELLATRLETRLVLDERYVLPIVSTEMEVSVAPGEALEVQSVVTVPWNVVTDVLATTSSRYVKFHASGWLELRVAVRGTRSMHDYLFDEGGHILRERLLAAIREQESQSNGQCRGSRVALRLPLAPTPDVASELSAMGGVDSPAAQVHRGGGAARRR